MTLLKTGMSATFSPKTMLIGQVSPSRNQSLAVRYGTVSIPPWLTTWRIQPIQPIQIPSTHFLLPFFPAVVAAAPAPFVLAFLSGGPVPVAPAFLFAPPPAAFFPAGAFLGFPFPLALLSSGNPEPARSSSSSSSSSPGPSASSLTNALKLPGKPSSGDWLRKLDGSRRSSVMVGV